MYDKNQFKMIVETVLQRMGPKYRSEAAVNLLLGTAAQESRFGTYLYQIGGGPAQGVFQMEPATEKDIWENYLKYDPDKKAAVYVACGRTGPGDHLTTDIAYQIAMCRMHYWRKPGGIPNDLEGQAAFYKQHFNTPLGAATVEEYIANYKKYVGV